MQNVKHNMLIALFVMIAAGFKCPEKAQLDLFLSGGIDKEFFDKYRKSKKSNKKKDMASFCESQRKEIEKNNPEVEIKQQTEYLIRICMNSNEYSLDLKTNFLNMNVSGDEDNKFNPVIKHMEMSTFSIIVKITLGLENYVLKIGRDHLRLPDYKIVSEEENEKILESNHMMKKEVDIINEFKNDEYRLASEMFIERCIIEFGQEKSSIVVMKDGEQTLKDFLDLENKEDEQNYLKPEDRKKLYQRFFKILEVMEEKKISLCDFKPDNTLFDKEKIDEIKLIDFGAVKFNNEACKVITSIYAPPEANQNYYESLLIEENKNKFWDLNNGEYRNKIINEIIKYLDKKNCPKKCIGLTSYKEKYTNLQKSESNLKKQDKNSELSNERLNEVYNKFKEDLNQAWDDIKENDEYHKYLDSPRIEENTNSEEFDIFSLGIVIFEIELKNYKKLCKEDESRKAFIDAYKQLMKSGKDFFKKEEDTSIDTKQPYQVKNVPSMEIRRIKIRDAFNRVYKHIPLNVRKLLYDIIYNKVLIDRPARLKLAEFKEQVEETLKNQHEKGYAKQYIII